MWFSWFRGKYQTFSFTKPFGPHPFTWKTPTPTGRYPDSRVWVCALFLARALVRPSPWKKAKNSPPPPQRKAKVRKEDQGIGNTKRAITTTSALPSSLGALDATSKVPLPLRETEARQHKPNKDIASDVCLSCSCRPWTGAEGREFGALCGKMNHSQLAWTTSAH